MGWSWSVDAQRRDLSRSEREAEAVLSAHSGEGVHTVWMRARGTSFSRLAMRDRGAPRLSRTGTRVGPRLGAVLGIAMVLAGCATTRSTSPSRPRDEVPASTSLTTSPASTRTSAPTLKSRTVAKPTVRRTAVTAPSLPAPSTLQPFASAPAPGEGTWHAAGRPVDGVSAVYETSLRPPGSSQPAGIAWLDSHLLAARLYSGSASPGGGPWRYTAPVQPAQAATLVAAFNGGFKMSVAGGGYYTQHRMVVPLQAGAASLVIYANGLVSVGAWGTDVSMTPKVVGVRQNLVLLVDGGQPTTSAADWPAWGVTVGNVEYTWRSGLGITAAGALVYATGPDLNPLQLAQLLVRAGATRAMELDINPDWTILATYDPPSPTGLASPQNGAGLVVGTVQGPWTFFEPTWARDFVTMSARSGPIP
jgi:hypothetical protein